MNYRHIYHAGNVADLFKHAVLLLLMQRYRAKNTPFMMLDTHAGAGLYEVTSEEAQKTGEANYGFMKLRAHANLPPVLARMIAVAKLLEQKFSPHHVDGTEKIPRIYYAGSPLLASLEKRAGDRLILCEKHPEEAQKLRQNMRQIAASNSAIHERDGYEAIKAFLPPPEQRGLVLIDPPYENTSEERDCLAAVKNGLIKFPAGCFVVWYPIKDHGFNQRFLAEFKNLPAKSVLVAAILHGDLGQKTKKPANAAQNSAKLPSKLPGKLIGSGLVMVNPPWQIETEIQSLGQNLLTLLGIINGRVECHYILADISGGIRANRG